MSGLTLPARSDRFTAAGGMEPVSPRALRLCIAYCACALPIALARCLLRLRVVHRACALPIALARCLSRLRIAYRVRALSMPLAHCLSRSRIAAYAACALPIALAHCLLRLRVALAEPLRLRIRLTDCGACALGLRIAALAHCAWRVAWCVRFAPRE